MEVTTKLGDKTATVNYNFGATLEESVAIFGEKAVHDHFVRNAKIALQGVMSRLVKADKSQKEIEAAAAEFKLEGRRPAQSKAEKARALLEKMTPEEREAFKALIAGGSKKAA